MTTKLVTVMGMGVAIGKFGVGKASLISDPER